VPHLLGQRSSHVLLHPAIAPADGLLRMSRRWHLGAADELASHDMRCQYHYMDNGSGVGVLDKASVVLGALESGPSTLAQLVATTGLARPTAHRLAVALEHHRI